jgi:hypothetical protein
VTIAPSRARRVAALLPALVLSVAAGVSVAAEEGPALPEPLDRLLRGAFAAPLRYRHEYRDDYDFRDDRDDGDDRDLLKVNLGVDARPVDPVRVRVAGRQTRTWGRNQPPSPRIDRFGHDRVDLFEGHVEVGPFEGVPFSAVVGRQVLAFGEERLVGPLEFVQNANVWDAARLRLTLEDVRVDAWWGRLVLFEGPDDRNANRPVDTVDFFGAYGSVDLGGPVIEPFYLLKYDDNHVIASETGGRTGHVLLRSAPGARAKVPLALGFDLYADAVIQFGRQGRDDIFAWGAAGKVVWSAPEEIRPLWQLEVEYVYGSGDTNPRDGKRGTFDNFYPTNHKFYGEMDLASWQNIHDLELTARAELWKVEVRAPPPKPPEGAPAPPRPHIWERAPRAVLPDTLRVTLEVGYHHLWLASPKDAWFNAPLGTIRRDPTGAAGRDLGDEADIVLRAGPLSLAYAHFFPGPYVRRTTPAGGNASGADLVYVEAALAF